MTDNSKENLLKILLNEQNETPSTNISDLINDGNKSISIATSLIQTQLSYNNYTIILYLSGELVLYDSEYNVLMDKYLIINNIQTTLLALDVDEEGNFYGITYNGSRDYLVYLNKITIPNANGEYVLEAKKTYDIWDIFSEIGTETGTAVMIDKFTLKKSPIDSRFLIIVDGHTATGYDNNLLVINYKVNVGSTNDYEYRTRKIGTYNANSTQSVYINWTTDNAYIFLFSMNFTYGSENYYTPFAVNYYWSLVNWDEGSTIRQNLIHSNNTCIKSGAQSSSVLKSSNEIWFVDATKNSSTQDVTTNLYLYKGGVLNTKFTVSGTEYSNSNAIYINNQLFISILPKVDSSNNRILLFQVIGDDIEKLLDITAPYYTNALMITNNFNLFNIYINGVRYKYIYSPHYNGTEYFSDNSLNSVGTELYGINLNGSTNIMPIFVRDLYNKSVLGNSVISTIQVPFGYLNNSIITNEKLISKNNNIIDDSSEEIIKNEYEELYINNVDAYKIYDDNLGHIYNQNGSLQLAKSIQNDFIYKIEKYRVNYIDGRHKEHSINHIVRNGKEALIEIYVRNENVDNIQLFDKNFTAPFVTISLDGYDLNKIYKIKQYVKVE